MKNNISFSKRSEININENNIRAKEIGKFIMAFSSYDFNTKNKLSQSCQFKQTTK